MSEKKPPSHPKRVRVGPVYYAVKWVDKKCEAYGNWGVFISEPGLTPSIILVKTDRRREATHFLHEVFHAIIFEMGGDIKTMNEEDVVNSLAATLTKFWQDNPSALRWYSRALK